MRRIHIIGGKNHGKTTLVTSLVEELSARGYRVGTIKHTHHHHELDVPGKDSYLHRQAGAAVVGILSPGMNAVFWERRESVRQRKDDDYSAFEPMFDACQLILVEGDSGADAPKIEVWRAALGAEPLAKKGASVDAIVSQDQPSVEGAPVWPRDDVPGIATRLLTLLRSAT